MNIKGIKVKMKNENTIDKNENEKLIRLKLFW